MATTGLIEIDAVEIFGFLSGSYSRLNEKERGRIARQSSLLGCLYSPESALNRGRPIWKADKAYCGLRFTCHLDKLTTRSYNLATAISCKFVQKAIFIFF